MTSSKTIRSLTLALSAAACSLFAANAWTAPSDATADAKESRPPPTADATSPAYLTAYSTPAEIQRKLAQTIGNLRELRDALASKDIPSARREQAWFDSGVIGLGLASVAAALTRTPTTPLGLIALGGAGLGQYRSYYNPQGKEAAYVAAAKAARCLYSSASPLLTQQPWLMWREISRLEVAEARVDVTSSQGGLSADGAAAATKALQAADPALAKLNTEAEVFNSLPSVVDTGHDQIKDYIEKSLIRQVVDFSTVQGQLQTAAQQTATSTVQGQTAASNLVAATAAQGQAQVTAQAAAQAAGAGGAPAVSGTAVVSQPPEQVAMPGNLAAASTAAIVPASPTPGAASPATPATIEAKNLRAVAALNATTLQALQQFPDSPYTSAKATLIACTSGLGQ